MFEFDIVIGDTSLSNSALLFIVLLSIYRPFTEFILIEPFTLGTSIVLFSISTPSMAFWSPCRAYHEYIFNGLYFELIPSLLTVLFLNVSDDGNSPSLTPP